jgi:hypothetical protein
LAVAIIVLFAKIAELHWLTVSAVFLSTGFGLINNFLFGQMYLLLLATIAGGICLQQARPSVSRRHRLGQHAPIKYVGAFFLIYFIWKKNGGWCWQRQSLPRHRCRVVVAARR